MGCLSLQDKRTALQTQPPHTKRRDSNSSDDGSGVGSAAPYCHPSHSKPHDKSGTVGEQPPLKRAPSAERAYEAVATAAAEAAADDYDDLRRQHQQSKTTARPDSGHHSSSNGSASRRIAAGEANLGDSQHAKLSSQSGESAQVDTVGQAGDSAEIRPSRPSCSRSVDDKCGCAPPEGASSGDRPTFR